MKRTRREDVETLKRCVRAKKNASKSVARRSKECSAAIDHLGERRAARDAPRRVDCRPISEVLRGDISKSGLYGIFFGHGNNFCQRVHLYVTYLDSISQNVMSPHSK